MRIALASAFAWPEVTRGGERYLHDLASYLHSRGHQVDVVAGTDQRSGVETIDGVRFVWRHRRLPAFLARRGTTGFDVFGAAALLPLLRRRYDVVHCLAPTAAVAARLGGQCTILTVMGHPTDDQLGLRPLDRQLMSAGVCAAHTITAYSEASAVAVEAIFGRRAVALNLGVRLERFPIDPEPRLGAPRILFPAYAADARKRVDLLLQAMPAILDARPDARVALLGGGAQDWAFDGLGDDEQRVRAAVDDLGRHVDDVGQFFRDATVVVLPSRYEAFGVVLVESLASGTPVVCTDDGGMPEIVTDPKVGRVAPPDDPAGLAEAILAVIELAAQPSTPARCAAHARRWDWDEAIGPAHEALYERVVGR